MKSSRTIVGVGMLALFVAGVVVWSTDLPHDPIPLQIGWGGKAEHCAMAIGVIGASILSLFANPLSGPVAVGAMSLGLIWMVATCE